jgi:hypothetical protein
VINPKARLNMPGYLGRMHMISTSFTGVITATRITVNTKVSDLL